MKFLTIFLCYLIELELLNLKMCLFSQLVNFEGSYLERPKKPGKCGFGYNVPSTAPSIFEQKLFLIISRADSLTCKELVSIQKKVYLTSRASSQFTWFCCKSVAPFAKNLLLLSRVRYLSVALKGNQKPKTQGDGRGTQRCE